MLVSANLEKRRVDYIDLYRPNRGSVNGKYYVDEEADDIFPQPMLVQVRGKSHFLAQLLLVGLICSPALLLLYFVFIEQTMFILQPVKGGGYNILLLVMAIICLPSMLVTTIAFFYTSIQRKWLIVSRSELRYLDQPGLYSLSGIFTKSFYWKEIHQVEFRQGTDYQYVWDLLRWNPVWPVPNWEIRIKVKEYYLQRENAFHDSLSLGSISERDIQELQALFSALVPAEATVILSRAAESAS